MKHIAAVMFLAVCANAEVFRDVTYFAKVQGKEKAEQVEGRLETNAADKAVVFSGKTGLRVPYGSISNIVYERAAKPRYAAGLLFAWPLLFTKSKSHFLTLQYKDGEQGKYAVFKLDKGNYREVIAAMEAGSGRKVERQEER